MTMDPEYLRDQKGIEQPWSQDVYCKGSPSIGTGCGFCKKCVDYFSTFPDPVGAQGEYVRNRSHPALHNQIERRKTPDSLLKRFRELSDELARYEELFGVGSDLAEQYCGNNQANLGRAQECLTVAKFAVDNLIGYGS